MNSLKETTEECLVAKFTCGILEEVSMPDTSEHLLYVDEDQNDITFLDFDEEIIPEVGDEYRYTSMMLHPWRSKILVL